MTYFHRDVTDLIEFVMANAESAYYDNIGQSTVDGVEVEGAWALPRWQVNLAYTWMRSENLSPGARYGKPLPNRPTHAAHLRVVHDLSDQLSAFVEGKFVGGNAFDQTGDLAMSDLTTVDLGVTWTRQDGGVVTAGVRDLFDAASEARLVPFKGPEQMPWYPSAGRTWFLSLRWSW
ncbi:MAG TPA: TonB-dependent receptor, partial [Synergistaceae bacterium]|nr:TonB-dependent receptor [Synergistaceae bacterium]